MAPALRAGDQVLAWTPRWPRPGAGAVVVVDLPGGRGLGIKRVHVVHPDGSVWLEGDNPFGSTDSRQFGPVPARAVRGRVVLRLWPRPGPVAPREPEGPRSA
jgi:hypothetical protein